MATLAIMVGGAVLNAATFIGGNYLAKYLSGDSGQAALDEKGLRAIPKGSHPAPGLGCTTRPGKG